MNKFKTLSMILVVLMILPSFLAIFNTQTATAQATPTIETSADVAGGYFTDGVFVEVTVTDTGRAGDGTITVNLYQNGAPQGSITLYEVGSSGVFKVWLVYNVAANPDQDVDVTPFGNNLGVAANEVLALDSEFGLTLTAGDTITLEYVGASGTVTATLTYDTYDETISVDRTEVPAFDVATVYVTIVDQDFNYDPSAVDTFTGADLTVTVTAYDVLGTAYTVTGSLPGTVTFTETDVNSATFVGMVTLDQLLSLVGTTTGPAALNIYVTNTDVTGAAFNLVDFNAIANADNGNAPFDHLELSVPSGSAATFSLTTSMGYVQSPTSATTVSLATELPMTLVDPDMNFDTGVKDTVNVQVDVYSGATLLGTIFVTLTETGYDTGVFEGSATLTYGPAFAANDATDTLTLDQPYTLEITYVDPSAGVATAVVDVDVSATDPTLTSDKTEALPIQTVTLTLTDPDLNDNGNNTLDSFGQSVSASSTLSLNLAQGQFNVYVNGVLATASTNFFLFFQEVSPGVFEATFDLQWIGPLADGDVVTFEWVDQFSSGVPPTASVDVTIVKPTVSVSLDRNVYPLPNNGQFTLWVTVDNQYLNTLPGVAETIPATSYTIDITLWDGVTTYSVTTVPLQETDVDTGIFEAPITVNLAGFNPNLEVFTGATITVTYTYQANTYVAEATIQPNTAVLTVNGTGSISTNMGDYVTITLVEPDANVDSRQADTVTLTTSGLTGPITLTETGLNTGVFTDTFRVGADAPFNALLPTSSWSASYFDAYTATTSPTFQRTSTLSISGEVLAHTGMMWVGTFNETVTEIGPYTTMTIYYQDPDLILDWENGVPQNLNLYIRGSMRYAPGHPSAGQLEEETQTSLGNFMPDPDHPATFMVTVPVQLGSPTDNTIGPGDGTLNVLVPDTIVIQVVDPISATGLAKSMIQWVDVMAWDGQLSVEPEAPFYNDQQDITIWVYDPDQNINPNVIDTVQVSITSWRLVNNELQVVDPVGTVITLFENGTNTGWFKGIYTIDVTSPPPFFEIGDVLRVEYMDPLAADGTAKVTGQVDLQIGFTTPTPVSPGAAENVTFADLTGAPTTPQAGVPILVNVPVTNVDTTRSVTVDVILVAYTPDGVPVGSPSFSRVTLAPGESTTISVGWLPPASGDFVVKVFFWNLADRVPLSEEPLEFSITVA